MTHAEIEQIISQETKDLPSSTLVEVLDFVRFLKQKLSPGITKSNGDNLSHELSLLNEQELQHVEKEFSNYQELFPRES
ncbi:MAG: hypothetical protein HYZ34_09935 [Ignavibacteriae bacterium]|nr:hypothetical protein [Ignavibacteriota bacterium]